MEQPAKSGRADDGIADALADVLKRLQGSGAEVRDLLPGATPVGGPADPAGNSGGSGEADYLAAARRHGDGPAVPGHRRLSARSMAGLAAVGGRHDLDA